MLNKTSQIDKYLYTRVNPLIVKILGVSGITATLLMSYGLWQFISLNTIYLLLFGPIIAIYILNKLLRYSIQIFYPKFDIGKHIAFISSYWRSNDPPSVDVFLPWAGESLKIHEEVLKAVSEIDYPNFQVYMLDDVGDEQHKKLAQKYGFNYLSRPNKGEYKKSGNLQFGYENSNGEYIFILDADFVPKKCALRDLVPYMATDKSIGILQTPQYFEQSHEVHSRSKIEFGGGNIVEEFYRIIMPCRDQFKAAMCVGTSALYRRDTITKLEGTPKVHASEDLATGLLITRYGYYVKYIPLIISIGRSPDTYQGYFKQHMRWCSGNLVFAQYWPFARLSVMARLVYLINPFYYISEAFGVVFSFQFLILLYFHADTLSIYHSLYFLPYAILSQVVVPNTKVNKHMLGTKLAALSNNYTYFYTFLRMLLRNIPAWHPSGVKINGIHKDFISAINIGTFVSCTYIAMFTFVILARYSVLSDPNTYVVLGWSIYTVTWHVLFLTLVSNYIHPYRIEKANTAPARIFAHVKTSMIIVLFGVMISSVVFGFIQNRDSFATIWVEASSHNNQIADK